METLKETFKYLEGKSNRFLCSQLQAQLSKEKSAQNPIYLEALKKLVSESDECLRIMEYKEKLKEN